MNRWRRQMARAAVCAGLVLAVTAFPSAAAIRPTLTRQVTVTGDRTGWVAVTLPKPIQPTCPQDPACRAKAALRFTGGAFGYALQYENDTAKRPVPNALVVRLPKAQGGDIYTVYTGTDPRNGVNISDTGILPAGRYRLFILTKGRGSVTVRFPELPSGSLSLRPTKSAPMVAEEHTPDYVGPLAPTTWASGITVEPNGRRSHGYSFMWVSGPAAAGSFWAGCVYDGDPWGGRWIPGCPFGQQLMANQIQPARDCCGTGHGHAVGGGDRFSFGQYYVQNGPITNAGMFFVWLPER